MEAEMNVTNLLWKSFVGSGSMGGLEKLLNALEEGAEDDEDDLPDDDEAAGWGFGWGSQKASDKGKKAKSRNSPTVGGIWTGDISEEVESKYLTMSWWLLHVGWKDVGERVRRGVEEVFEGYDLVFFCPMINVLILSLSRQRFTQNKTYGRRPPSSRGRCTSARRTRNHV